MYIGVDVGGTNLVAALVTPEGGILFKASRPTRPEREQTAIIADLVDLIRQVFEACREEIQSIGIGIPGVVDSYMGRVIRTPNMPFDGLPLATILGGQWSVPILLENDANAAALGEFLTGAAQGAQSMVMVTLGTGIGGGIVMDGRVMDGIGGAAAEIGHMVIRQNGLLCGCGRRGCWEMYASARALIRMTTDAMQTTPDSFLHEELTGNPPHVSGRTAFLAARRGDAVAQSVVDEYMTWLSEGLLNIINILQPEILCIGGGISGEGSA